MENRRSRRKTGVATPRRISCISCPTCLKTILSIMLILSKAFSPHAAEEVHRRASDDRREEQESYEVREGHQAVEHVRHAPHHRHGEIRPNEHDDSSHPLAASTGAVDPSTNIICAFIASFSFKRICRLSQNQGAVIHLAVSVSPDSVVAASTVLTSAGSTR